MEENNINYEYLESIGRIFSFEETCKTVVKSIEIDINDTMSIQKTTKDEDSFFIHVKTKDQYLIKNFVIRIDSISKKAKYGKIVIFSSFSKDTLKESFLKNNKNGDFYKTILYLNYDLETNASLHEEKLILSQSSYLFSNLDQQDSAILILNLIKNQMEYLFKLMKNI